MRVPFDEFGKNTVSRTADRSGFIDQREFEQCVRQMGYGVSAVCC